MFSQYRIDRTALEKCRGSEENWQFCGEDAGKDGIAISYSVRGNTSGF